VKEFVALPDGIEKCFEVADIRIARFGQLGDPAIE